MSLHRDFLRYYGGSWVGFEHDGVVKPAYVSNIRCGNGFAEDDHSDEARDNLRMELHVMVDSTGNSENLKVLLSDERVKLDQEELGYAPYRGEVRWFTWKPVRCTVKGLCAKRLEGFREGQNLPSETIWGLYEMRRTKNATQRQFLFDNGKVFYKNREVGTYVEDGSVTLNRSFAYLRNTIMKHFHPIVEQVLLENEDA